MIHTAHRRLTPAELEGVLHAVEQADPPAGAVIDALVKTYHALLGVDEICEPFRAADYSIPKDQTELILEAVRLRTPQDLFPSALLTWMDKGPGSYTEGVPT